MIKSEVKQSIRMHSLEEIPNECCGLLVENEETGTQIFKCKNSSKENKRLYFSIAPEEYLVATTLGDIVAIYHSHTEGKAKPQFSEMDKRVSKNHNIFSILYDVQTDSFLEHDPKS